MVLHFLLLSMEDLSNSLVLTFLRGCLGLLHKIQILK